MEKLIEYHYFLFKENGDERVYNWPLMSSPWMPIGIISLYLSLIYIFLPRYMSKRKPYSLKGAIIVYNVFQIVANAIIAYWVTYFAWTGNYTLGCQAIDNSKTGPPLSMAKWYWWCLMVKILDLMDTIFFVLRKKYSQVSTFHVCHHGTTILIIWTMVKYIPGGMSFLCVCLNSGVHTIMYTYYLLSSLGSDMQRKMRFFKPMITLLQMAHLVILTIHASVPLLPICKYSKVLTFTTLPGTLMNLNFFYKFYKQSYMKEKNN